MKTHQEGEWGDNGARSGQSGREPPKDTEESLILEKRAVEPAQTHKHNVRERRDAQKAQA